MFGEQKKLQHGTPVNFCSIYLGFVTCRGNIKIPVKSVNSPTLSLPSL